MSDGAVQGTSAIVRLVGDKGAQWRGVSPALVRGRLLVLAAVVVPMLLVALVLGVWVSRWFWVPVLLLAALGSWGLWLVPRQVRAISYAETPEELVIRRGRLLRELVAIPYGRMQYVDLQSGPLARRLGYAELEIHTASPSSNGALPGLPVAQAEALRERLAARGESQRAGL